MLLKADWMYASFFKYVNKAIIVLRSIFFFQVSELVKKYGREHITVWGNFKDVVTRKCYKMVRD